MHRVLKKKKKEEEEDENEKPVVRGTRVIDKWQCSLFGSNRRRDAISIELLIARVDRSREWRRSAN